MKYPFGTHQSLLPLLCASALVALPAGAAAGDSGTGGDWQYDASVYLWGAGINGSTVSGSDVDVGFDTLISNLNMAFMGTFEARKSGWSALADVVYLNVGDDAGVTVPVTTEQGAAFPLKVEASVKVKGWVLSLLGGYNIHHTDQLFADVIAGARYLDLSLDLDLGLQSGRFGRPIEVSAGDGVWDAIVGVRGHANLNDKWYLPYQFDFGTGESDLTWQAAGGVGYRFHWGDLNLIYRHMEWDFASSSPIEDMSFSGPLLAAKFRF